MGVGGVTLLTTSEGYVPRTYLDSGGIPTVCTGHTGPDVIRGRTYTQAECAAFLEKDIRIAAKGLQACVTQPLTVNQRGALISLTFNVGVSRVCKSTLVRKLNAGDFGGASQEFPKWSYARVNGKLIVLRGLATRRAAEQRLFLTKDK